MIIPSKEVLLVTPSENKQLFMFDAKTGCVLHKYTTESALAPSVAYYEPAQQLIIPHLNNTYINIWQSDAQEPKKFSVGEGQKICSLLIFEKSILLMGSNKGNLYIFELPSGINLRKVSIHSNSIMKIQMLESGHLITCSVNQVKLWAMAEFIGQRKTPIAQRTLHSASQIIDFSYTRNMICLMTQNTVKLYYSTNLQELDRQFPILQKLSHFSCLCATRSGFYIANVHGKIVYLNLDVNSREFGFDNNRKQINIKKVNNEQEIDAKDPITSLGYLSSLHLLVSGNCKGQIKIWENGKLKNSMQLFKSSISHLFTFAKPNKSIKIPHNSKIKALHKQQLTKLEQPIIVYSERQLKLQQKTEEEYLDEMLGYLSDPLELLQTQIEMLKEENKQLLNANLHYEAYFEKNDNV